MKLDIDDINHKTETLDEPIKGKPRSETIVSVLDDLRIRYIGQQTPHGKHLFFRVPDQIERRHKMNWYCPLGIRAEWKFPESDDHIVLNVNGKERPFFKGKIEDLENIDELPAFLYPLQKSNVRKFDMTFPEGDRTQKLGAYLFYLVKEGLSAEQAFQIVRLLNKYVFENPIPANLLDSQVLNESTFQKLTDNQKDTAEKKIAHSDLAKEIIGQFDLITVNGDFYSYENGVYRPFPNGRITNYLTANYPKLNSNYEREVIRHIKGLTYTEYPSDNGTVNVKNGILTFAADGTVTLSPHTKEQISFKQFNAAYDPAVDSSALDTALCTWFNGSSKNIELFNQLLGYLLMNHVNYQKIFFFVGAPSTGKTTLLKLIISFCGSENISTIQLDDMGKPFGLASIVNKTANIFSDIRKTKVLTSDVFKMLADGSPLKINQKYKEEFTYCFTGKLLFGMNSYPDFSQDFEGIERRLVIFEFKHVFKKDDANFDPAILESLSTAETMSALLNKAVKGYKSLIENKGFITTRESETALTEFVSANDSVIRWLKESEIEADQLLQEPISTENGHRGLYPDYQSFCFGVGETPKAQKDFSRTICAKYGFETYRPRIKGIRTSMFRNK